MTFLISVSLGAFFWLLWLLRRDRTSLGLPIAYLYSLLLIHVPGALVHAVGASEARIFPSLAKIETRRIYHAYATVGGDGAEERPRRIACVGRVAPIKGQELLLDSMRQLGRAWPDVECVILGGGDSAYVEQLRQASPTNVKWAGVVREVMPVLRACSVLVLPSHREPLGRVIFEAWDAGAVPVVFAGSGGAAEVVEAANGGFMYQEQTPGSLREVLDRARHGRNRSGEAGEQWPGLDAAEQ